MRYFHVPKAGSSFAPTVWAYSCARLPFRTLELHARNLSLGSAVNLHDMHEAQRRGECPCLLGSLDLTFHHAALKGEQDVLDAVGLFRSPVERVVSEFNYGLHAHMIRDDNAMQSAVMSSNERAKQLATFARWPGISHAQTRMLLGHEVSAAYTPTAGEVERACHRVQRMKFVGLLECFTESVDLFKQMFPSRYSGSEDTIHYRDTLDWATRYSGSRRKSRSPNTTEDSAAQVCSGSNEVGGWVGGRDEVG